MLRHMKSTRPRAAGFARTTIFVRHTCTALALLASPGVYAHAGLHATSDRPQVTAYMPYSGGMGDPLHFTSSRRYAAATAGETGSAASDNPLVARVREANGRFADVATARAESYAPIPCVSGIEGGAMGIHYVNAAYLDDPAVEIGKPEAVMYEPQADGSLALVAVEYITHQGPAQLNGHLFSFVGAPNRYGLDPFYELHVWAWRANPTGAFADMNPHVSCDAATAAAN